jgi:hypothetical protein
MRSTRQLLPMPDHRGDLWIANTVSDLIQGDVHEHLPLAAIPLKGDVLGLGTTTTTSIDNGELTFLPNSSGNTTIWKCQASGRVTIPSEGAHLHLHGCSVDLRYGGHLHHEHPGSSLRAVKRLVLYPLQPLHTLVSDLAVEQLRFEADAACFRVVNRGVMDVSDVGLPWW